MAGDGRDVVLARVLEQLDGLPAPLTTSGLVGVRTEADHSLAQGPHWLLDVRGDGGWVRYIDPDYPDGPDNTPLPLAARPTIGDLEDMAHVLSKLGLELDDAKMGSRCAACNGLLEEVARKDARGVPAGVLERRSQFFRCTVCGKVYWEGGHMEKMSAFAKQLRARLAKG